VRIIQGYTGGTHAGRSQYGLDIVLAGGGTSGAVVVSPVDGSVAWAQPPGSATGCMAVALASSAHSVVLCHVQFERAFRSGERIARGQPLGTVGAAGRLGNNGTPHVHFEIHRGTQGRDPVPFGTPNGLLLEGLDLGTSGARSEHAGRPTIVSSNPGGPPAAAPTSAPAQASAPQPAEPQPAPPSPTAAPPTPRPAPTPASVPEQAAAAT
jgi:murein DD-endopeptidase MepM/ murein hydrolase activator NlpD